MKSVFYYQSKLIIISTLYYISFKWPSQNCLNFFVCVHVLSCVPKFFYLSMNLIISLELFIVFYCLIDIDILYMFTCFFSKKVFDFEETCNF